MKKKNILFRRLLAASLLLLTLMACASCTARNEKGDVCIAGYALDLAGKTAVRFYDSDNDPLANYTLYEGRLPYYGGRILVSANGLDEEGKTFTRLCTLDEKTGKEKEIFRLGISVPVTFGAANGRYAVVEVYADIKGGDDQVQDHVYTYLYDFQKNAMNLLFKNPLGMTGRDTVFAIDGDRLYIAGNTVYSTDLSLGSKTVLSEERWLNCTLDGDYIYYSKYNPDDYKGTINEDGTYTLPAVVSSDIYRIPAAGGSETLVISGAVSFTAAGGDIFFTQALEEPISLGTDALGFERFNYTGGRILRASGDGSEAPSAVYENTAQVIDFTYAFRYGDTVCLPYFTLSEREGSAVYLFQPELIVLEPSGTVTVMTLS